jgi:hypothetical protein
MKRLLSIFLMIVVVFAGAAIAAPLLTSAPADLFVHCLSVKASIASIAIAAPSYTINEWCQLRRYSRAEWYRMKARGDGPDTIGEGRMTRIPPDADARWLRKQERKAKAEQTKAA